MKRTVTIRLIPNRDAEAKLKALCSLGSKLWNEVNYARRRMFFEAKRVDLKSTYKEFYEKYKTLLGSATTQQVLNKNDEAWKSFFSLLKTRKEGKLPLFIARVNPPGYRKRGGKRVLWAVLRNDQYRFEGDHVVLKGLGAVGSIRIRYLGRIHIMGEQGRAEIRYDPDERKWYMHVSFEVREKIIRDKMIRVPTGSLGNKVAGIDIGVNNLLAIYVEDGSALLVSGRPLKSISFYWRKKIADYQSTLNRYGLKTSKRLRRLFKKWRRQTRSYINWAVRNAVEWLYARGVSEVVVGYPKYITQAPGKNPKTNFEVVHVWSYGYLLRRLAEVAEEYGISVEFVSEEYTSTTCPLCKTHIAHRRIARGLLKCYKHSKAFNADLVGAFNILSKKKPITPSPTLSGVGVTRLRPGAGLNPAKPGNVAPNLPARTLTL
ncbi:RNA-guided endonuclease InsQ/TnpB family protein [Desulfurococcus amylolyticus]|uniref:Transposase, IS605 OrfB family n=1 Tax=Desulfurococcus amylolyticus DSM 16532 TaxID=768672 RepID=I3XTD2_DESAM|nr:RNA-guided endonuclease TnpB family protein [Desulfurococcus amylolyticus]AFL67206.1 transposase, IS605 OrfB family [Desulfurococcus amylolyticus DSM 16532]